MALLERRDVAVDAAGLAGPGDLARLLVRLERNRTNGVVAVKRDGRTIEIAFRGGILTGAYAWGNGSSNDDSVQQLATANELRPEDVPVLRHLHAQRLVIGGPAGRFYPRNLACELVLDGGDGHCGSR